MTLLCRYVLFYNTDSLQYCVCGAGENHEAEYPQYEPSPPGNHPISLGVENNHLVALSIFVPDVRTYLTNIEETMVSHPKK